MTYDVEAKSYPKMVFGEDVNLLRVEGSIYNAELVICDMAGTTVEDEGLVLEAFRNTAVEMELTIGSTRFENAINYALETMGYSKIEVFRHIFDNETEAQQANSTFETQYAKLVTECGVAGIPGATSLFAALKSRSIKVALTTGFSKTTQDLILEKLDWKNQVDYFGTPNTADRGRPFPDTLLSAMSALEIEDPQKVIVVGDTSSDIAAARAANVALSIGVLSGAHGCKELLDAKANLILDSVSDLVTLFYAFGKPTK